MTHEEAQKIVGVGIYRKIISAWQMSSANDTKTLDTAKKYQVHAELNKGGSQAYFLKLSEAYMVLSNTKYEI